MTEEQADKIIEILLSIDSRLDSIESNTPSSAYDLGDIHSKLGDIETAINHLD